ncbi:MAG: Chemotaxis response regulator protein-glutamate methylesterase [Verrucomicrobiota bacterium]|jgi:two-component system chemotaxis response regulator CheB
MQKIRTLVVDDSSFVRIAISEALSCDPEVEVIGTAANGRIALDCIRELKPDVITLDVDMPEMDGMAALRELRQNHPNLPVIMCSVLTEKGAIAALDALAIGATCCVTKPTRSSSLQDSILQLRGELLPKVKSLGPKSIAERRARIVAARRAAARAKAESKPELEGSTAQTEEPESSAIAPQESIGQAPVRPAVRVARSAPTRVTHIAPRGRVDIVVIGVSTGGPNALAKLLPSLPANFPVPIAIVQHMPPLFTKLVAERLNFQSPLHIAEARDSEVLLPGGAWIAPGDHHMLLEKTGSLIRARLNQDLPEQFCRPSVDVLFRSAVQTFGGNVLAIVLTGMGNDGTAGAREIRAKGGQVIVQDEESSVVWGMPGSIVEAGQADAVLPIDGIASEILQRVMVGRKPSITPANVDQTK